MSATKWSDGRLWGEADENLEGVWEAIDASVNYPEVIIAGVAYTSSVYRAYWRSGRSYWFAEPEAGSASLDLRGRIEGINIGDSIRIEAAPSGTLWTGRVDDITYSITPEGVETTITGSDWLAVFAATETPKAGLAVDAGDLVARLQALALYAGVPTAARKAPSSGLTGTGGEDPTDVALPVLNAGTVAGETSLLRYLAECEKASNAIVGIDPDGTWAVLYRSGLPDGFSPHTVTLEGTEEPFRGTLARASATRVVNAWNLGAVDPNLTDREASIGKYGRRSYAVSVDGSLGSSSAIWASDGTGIYYDGLLDSVAEPMEYATANVRVNSRLSPLVAFPAFGFIAYNNRVWQAIGMEWTVDPEPETITGWEVGLTLDTTQDELGARPPVQPPTVVTKTYSFTVTCNKDSYVVAATGGIDAGNGASENILVGLLTDGQLCRGLISFSLPAWKGRNRKITKADLTLTTSSHDCMTAGSSPSISIRRITSSWSEGTYAPKCSFASSNASKWPGPNTTSTGAVTRTMSTSDNTARTASIKTIAQAWSDGSPMYGLRLSGSSESSSSNRTEIWGRSHATSSRRPSLTIEYTYEEDA